MKTKLFHLALTIACVFGFASSLRAQAVYTADRHSSIQAGAGIMYANTDYVGRAIQGVSFWGDYDFSRFVGIEGSAHMGSIITPDDIAESSYMIGPRVSIHRRRFNVYAKLLVGRATISNQFYNTASTYNAYAFGGGLEYRAKRKFNIRAIDLEYQQWPDFEPHTLSPMVVTVGLAYSFR